MIEIGAREKERENEGGEKFSCLSLSNFNDTVIYEELSSSYKARYLFNEKDTLTAIVKSLC